MTQIEQVIPASAQQIFAVLADGWSYAGWVVGASHIRDVDPDWPAVGTRLHHSSGPWPLQIKDITVVRAVEQDRKLELEARLWVFGRVRITLILTPMSGQSTRVVMEETAIGGPAKILPHPVQALLLKPRNAEALARLADMATGRGATLR
jgi:polyketide cyclase/dehydrase/lipid transport protein